MRASASTVRSTIVLCLAWSIPVLADGITVLSPTTGDTLLLGESRTVTWRTDATGAGSYVTLQLYRDSEYDRTITSATYNGGSYTWTVPISGIDTSADYRVKVMSTTDSYVFGYSDTIRFRDEATLTVTAPDSTHTLKAGSSFTIRWLSTGSVGSYVSLQLYRGTEFVQNISSSTSNDGYQSWAVPAGLDTTDHYRIKVGSISKTSLFAYSDSFRVLDRWSLTVTSPDSADTFMVGASLPIRWSATGHLGTQVRLALYRHGTYQRAIASHTTGSGGGSHNWTMYSSYVSAGSGYQVQVASTSMDERSAMSDSFVVVDPPSITVTAPGDGDQVYYGDTVDVIWTSTGKVGDNVKIDLYRGTSYERSLSAATPNDGSFRWTVMPMSYEASNYRIRVGSTTSTSTYDYSGYFFLGDGSVPTITSPASGDTLTGGDYVTIAWKSSRIAGSYISLSLYRDSTYVLGLESSTYNDGVQSWTVPQSLPTSGAYQIVISEGASSQAVYSGMFTIDNTPGVTITRPAADAILESGTSVNIRWTSRGSLSRLALSYSIDQGYNWTVEDSSIVNDGSLYWTVPELDSITSCWLMLRNAADSLPFDMVEVVIGVRPKLVSLASPTLDRRPTFRWHPLEEGERYTIKIGTTSMFTAPIVTTPVADTFFRPQADLPAAKLYWQVTATSMPELPSAVDTVRIQDARVPMPIAVKPDPTSDRRVTLRWHPVEDASWYHIVVAASPSFYSPIVSVPTSDTVFEPVVDLPLGRIHWKVKSDLLDTYSTVQSFEILADTIPLLYGYGGDTVGTHRPFLAWKPVERASQYRIEVYDSAAKRLGAPLIAMSLDDTGYVPMVDLEPGIHYWRVSSDLAPGVYSRFDSLYLPEATPVVHRIATPARTKAAVGTAGGVVTVRYATVGGRPGHATIMSADGRRVATLALPAARPGFYEAASPRPLPSGAYIVRLRVDDLSVLRRVTIVR